MDKNKYLKLMEQMFSKSKEEVNEMYNSGVFNAITEGYFIKVLENLDADREFIEQALEELHHCHDTYRAGEVWVLS
ncbi:MAG: hypothetical protein K2N51_08795 [Lachnospiraceae bacterium]|nr:hypothetical protein [Lachnospiraceae bacterium]